MLSILTVIGTRPEAIKLAPFLHAINEKKELESRVCLTRQHTDLLDPLLVQLKIKADYQFVAERAKSSLHQQVASMLKQFQELFSFFKPDLVVVQGDTTTAFVASLAAFYSAIPVAHIEAGLRTGEMYSPWPEEIHRQLVDRISTYFFAPTEEAKNNLLSEGVRENKVWVVGNTSMDALRYISNQSEESVQEQRRFIIVTVHRRENHGEPLREICKALSKLAEEFSGVDILFFLHPNPHVSEIAAEMLEGADNIKLLSPLDHLSFIRLLKSCLFVITDSGGIQEEAPFFGKPLLVTRNTTERMEGVLAGTTKLVGASSEVILENCRRLLSDEEYLTSMSKAHFPYGDGYAGERIANILTEELAKKNHAADPIFR